MKIIIADSLTISQKSPQQVLRGREIPELLSAKTKKIQQRISERSFQRIIPNRQKKSAKVSGEENS